MSFFGDTFQIREKGIRFILFLFPVTLRWENVASVRKISMSEALTYTGYRTSISITSANVLIVTKGGWRIVGGPRKPDEFVQEVSQRLLQQKGSG